MFTEITGNVDEDGQVNIEWPEHLAPGRIRVLIIEEGEAEELAEDEARWDVLFAKSQDILTQLADEAHTEYLAGKTEEFDPDDPDSTLP